MVSSPLEHLGMYKTSYSVKHSQLSLSCAHIHTNMQAIMVNHDRFGLFRPTTDEDGKVIHPEWKTMRNVHLDVSL